jgi:hypothetical protein
MSQEQIHRQQPAQPQQVQTTKVNQTTKNHIPYPTQKNHSSNNHFNSKMKPVT